MLKKLLAAVVAATFMAGTAMGGDWDVTGGTNKIAGDTGANGVPLVNTSNSTISNGNLEVGGGTPANVNASNSGILTVDGSGASAGIDIKAGSTLANSGSILFTDATTGMVLTLGGKLANTGFIDVQETVTLTGAAGIDNSGSTLGSLTSGIKIDLTAANVTAAERNNLLAAVVTGNANIGNVVLTGDIAAGDADVVLTGATAGLVTLQNVTMGDGKIVDAVGADVKLVGTYVGSATGPTSIKGKNIEVATTANQEIWDLTATGGDITLSTANTYKGDVSAVASAAAGAAKNSVIVKAASTFEGDIDANLNVNGGDVTFAPAVTFNENITFTTDNKVVNQSVTQGNIDLSGKTLSGTGSFVNAVAGGADSAGIAGIGGLTAAGIVDMTGTKIEDGVKIVNAAAASGANAAKDGLIITDNAGLKALDGHLVLDIGDDMGYGLIQVTDNVAADTTLDWSAATGGVVVMNSGAANAQVMAGDVNLGAGSMWLLNGNGATVSGKLTAEMLRAATNATISNAVVAGIEVANGSAVTITKDGSWDASGKEYTLTNGVMDGTIANSGVVTIDKDTTIAVTGVVADRLTNTKDGTLNMDGENLATVNQFFNGNNAGVIGTVNINTDIADTAGIAWTGAAGDTVNLNAKQNMRNNNITVNNATINVKEGGDFAAMTGKAINIEDDSTFTGAVFATDDVTIGSGVDATFAAGVATNSITAGNGSTLTYGGVNAANTVAVANGGVLATTAAGAAFAPRAGAAAPTTFTVSEGGAIDARLGNINIAGYTAANIDGIVRIGAVNGLTTNNTKTTYGANTDVHFTNALARTFGDATANEANAPVVISAATAGELVYNGALGTNAVTDITGQYDLKLNTVATAGGNAAGTAIVVTNARNNTLTGVWSADADTTVGNLDAAFAKNGDSAFVDHTLAEAAHNVYFNTAIAIDPENTVGGGYNRATLQGIADGKSDHGAMKGFKGTYIGDTLKSVMSDVRGITTAIGTRNTALRGQMRGAGDVYYEYANPTLLLNNDYANRIWAGYLGNWEDADTRKGVQGYKYDSQGFIIGYDRLVGCNFAFGGAFAYSKGDFEDKAAVSDDSDIDNYSFNAYATYTSAMGIFANLFGGFTHSDVDISTRYRTIGVPVGTDSYSADYDAKTWHLGGQFGYDFTPIDNLVLTPSIGLTWIKSKADGHTRRQNGAAQAHYGSTDVDALLLPIEVAARYNIDFSNCSRLTLEGNVGYSYNFKKDGADAGITLAGIGSGGNPMYIRGLGREQERHTWNFGAGLRYSFNRFDVGVKYDYYLQSDADAHRVMATAGVSF